MMFKRNFLFLLSFLLIGCSPKLIVFNNSEPEPFAYQTICHGGDISVSVRFVSFTLIKEGDESLLWPTYNYLETTIVNKAKFESVVYQVRLANPKKRKIQISQNYIADGKQHVLAIYEGKLPLRSYDFEFEVDPTLQEMWIEIHDLKRKLTCVTPRAILQKNKPIAKENHK